MQIALRLDDGAAQLRAAARRTEHASQAPPPGSGCHL